MKKYIDADNLKDWMKKEVEKETQRIDKSKTDIDKFFHVGCRAMALDASQFIDSLQQEQPEVDIEKEYTEFVVSDPVYSKLVNGIVGKSIARHFYELGLNARKGE